MYRDSRLQGLAVRVCESEGIELLSGAAWEIKVWELPLSLSPFSVSYIQDLSSGWRIVVGCWAVVWPEYTLFKSGNVLRKFLSLFYTLGNHGTAGRPSMSFESYVHRLLGLVPQRSCCLFTYLSVKRLIEKPPHSGLNVFFLVGSPGKSAGPGTRTS